MQIRISDLMDRSCPDEVELGAADKAMAGRVNDAVMAKIGETQPKPRRTGRKTLRTLLLVAVIAALMGTAVDVAEVQTVVQSARIACKLQHATA